MPLWAWLFFVLAIAYDGFVLWGAWIKKYFRYGRIIYSVEKTPIYF
jgi:hypothetical protein